MPERTNAEIRSAICSKVADVTELLANLSSLSATAPDTVPCLLWSRLLCQAELIRQKAVVMIDTLAAADREPVEVSRASKGKPAK